MSKGRESGMPEADYWDSFFNPSCILSRLDCTGIHGDILEFGCGYGTFTIPAAKANSGKVIALDIEPDMVTATARKAREAGLPNVKAERRDFMESDCGIPAGTCQYAMLFNILHIERPVELLKFSFAALATGGKVGIIHWRSDIKTPRGPSPDIRPSAEQCRVWGEQAGLNFVRYESLCCCSWHWGLVMSRPALLA
ncbi:MAG: class I SAM-dependent methyltransferase [Planctomycetes bacterium]|nr:class I SAM-dependent methyltransferase [Planctomycetota bacterium]